MGIKDQGLGISHKRNGKVEAFSHKSRPVSCPTAVVQLIDIYFISFTVLAQQQLLQSAEQLQLIKYLSKLSMTEVYPLLSIKI